METDTKTQWERILVSETVFLKVNSQDLDYYKG